MLTFDIEKFFDRRILVVGDLMIDEYLWGMVDRISPEAPVPIVAVNREEFTLGGAGNVINNLVSLGALVNAVGVAGTGYDGNLLVDKLQALDVDIEGVVRDPERPTTRKTRIIASNQHVVRIDRETRKDVSKNTFDLLLKGLGKKIPESDLVLVSDYGKGILTGPLLSGIMKISADHRKMVIVDPKGLDFKKYAGATMITPNKKEASLASGIEIDGESSLFRAADVLLESVRMDRLLITCGKDGMVLFEKDAPPRRIYTEARQVFDVSGAGDTVLAVLGLALASGLSFFDAASMANSAAGIVVGKMGTAAVSREELKNALQPGSVTFSAKHKTIPELKSLISDLRKSGKKIVMTNGCFDLIHAGHIKLLQESRQLGDVLVVAVDDDPSVRKLKGPGRPIIDKDNRIRTLCALDSVDLVVAFSSDQLIPLLDIVCPDILTKGSNYGPDEVLGHDVVEKHGGSIRLIPITEDISSSTIIDSIRNNIKKQP